MKLLFILRSSENLFYTQSIIEEVLKRGHTLKVLYERDRGKENEMRLAALQDKYPNYSYGRAFWRTDKWRALLYYTRGLLSYRKYLFMQNQSPYYRERYKRYMHGFFRFFVDLPMLGNFINLIIKSGVSGKLLKLADDAAGLDPKVLEQVKAEKPDVVMICIGSLRYGSFDIDYLKVADYLRIPRAAFVMTWDSLSSKSLVQFIPDILFVLNELQKEEAITQHNVPAENIRVAGAAAFDRWFGGLKASPREEFCRKHNLRAEDPILLYLGSAKSTTGDETWVLEEIKRALAETSNARLANMQIIMRPHPNNTKYYNNMLLKDVITLPKGGQWPGTEDALRLFYDSLAHSIAAVGINTSAMIETMIVGKPMITIALDRYAKTQSLAMHFRKLLSEEGMIKVNNFEKLAEEIQKTFSGNDRGKEGRKKFIRKHIRPYGLEVSAASKICDELEKLLVNKEKSYVK